MNWESSSSGSGSSSADSGGDRVKRQRIGGGGVIFFSVNQRGNVSFLLGKECYEPGWRESEKWGAFGGSVEADETVIDAVAREVYEESCGVVYSMAEVRQKLQDHQYRMSITLHYRKRATIFYFIQIPYCNYPKMFKNAREFAQYVRGDIKCVEKSQLQWFSCDDLRQFLLQQHHRHHHQHPLLVEARSDYRTPLSNAFHNRRPQFRKKFGDLMRHFFDIGGERIVVQRPSGEAPARPMLFFHTPT